MTQTLFLSYRRNLHSVNSSLYILFHNKRHPQKIKIKPSGITSAARSASNTVIVHRLKLIVIENANDEKAIVYFPKKYIL